MGMSAAEKSFRDRVKVATAPAGYVHDLGGGWDALGDEGEILIRHWGRGIDLEAYERAFNLYGAYLELVGQDEPVEEHRCLIWPASRELVFVGHNEPTPVEEQTAVLNGTIHRSLTEMNLL